MADGAEEYWRGSEPHPRSGIVYIIIILIFLGLVFSFMIHIMLFRPVTNLEIEPVMMDGSRSIVLSGTNIGGIKEEFIDLQMKLTPSSKCRTSYKKEGCEEVVGNKLYCNYLSPGDYFSVECPLNESGTNIKITMRSKYQSTNLEFSCSAEKCDEIISPLSGSYPVLWNYLLAYPADRLVDFYNGMKSWLWGSQVNQTGQ